MRKIRGVNLGGWFVLERWMTQELFEENHVIGKDETVFNQQVQNVGEILNHHYQTFITKEDLVWIKDQGLNLVRLPIPWWLFGEEGYHKSIDYIDQAIEWFEELELPFQLDLHTAPGCQNGFDNGGIEGVLDWPKDQKNIDKTVEILTQVVSRYQSKSMFDSICVLNEPFLTVDFDIVAQFYDQSYHAIRQISDVTIVFHDSFRLMNWEEFIKRGNYTNIVLDAHLYQCFSNTMEHKSVEEHLAIARSRTHRLQEVSKYVDVIVGEWSLHLRHNHEINHHNFDEVMRQYASAQIEGMKDCLGYIFWSYKVTDKMGGWHFRQLVERGIIDISQYLS